MESQARGGTRWKRFGVVMVPSVAAAAAVSIALAQGALAASFTVSGQQFKVTADRLEAEGFSQYGAVDVRHDGTPVPVAVSAFDDATITNLCQSVVVPAPVIGDVTLRLLAGGAGSAPVKAENLFIDVAELNADAVFTNIDIGVSADHLDKGPSVAPEERYLEGSFAQQADEATLTDIEQTAWATSAGTFRLNGLSMSLHRGKDECF